MMYPTIKTRVVSEMMLGADEYSNANNPGGWNPLLLGADGLIDPLKLYNFTNQRVSAARSQGAAYLSVYDIEGHGFKDASGQNQSYIGDPFVTPESATLFKLVCSTIIAGGLLPGCTLRPTTLMQSDVGWIHTDTDPGGVAAIVPRARKAYALGCRYLYIDSNVDEEYNATNSPNQTISGVIPGRICSRLPQDLPPDVVICWEQFEWSMSAYGLSLIYMNSPTAIARLQSQPDVTFCIDDATVARAPDPAAARAAVDAAYAAGHFKIIEV